MNKTICIAISILCLLSACSEKLICPAYQSSFILDDNYRDSMFSPFEVVNGDTVPKGESDLQRNRSEFVLMKLLTRPERPVLENPYLLARVFNKRPFWKLDVLEPDVIFYSNTVPVRYSSTVMIDSIEIDIPVEYELTSLNRYPPYNVEQIEYNKKFGHLFPQTAEQKAENQIQESMEEFMSDTLAVDSLPQKKGLWGIFKKKEKNSKPKKVKRKDRRNNIDEGVLDTKGGR